MKVAGIDLSSHAVDVVLLELDSDEAVWTRYSLTGDDWLERLQDVHNMLAPQTSWWDDVCAIGIELPPVRPTHKLLPFFGAVVACLPQGPALKAYQPAEWKRLSVGKGNASKADVRQWGADVWRWENGDRYWRYALADCPQDMWDAYAIAWACRSELVVEAVA